MKIKGVQVKDRACFKRACYRLGFDRGVFVQGRGYVKYHDAPIKVCATRHLYGCPVNSVCSECRTASVETSGQCDRCGADLERK
jgi:hypothetical protein